eukprot:TRINITY_DN8103_c0_g1_i1.p1 TRINITY_DN8103_c0_g1~~TRINITY_DN8103_c0_g1_i1.p1  ORF type:complete len:519 (-),score=137.06 TRINITY_DN8103_c0_g1_i1:255-1811(-)
MFSTFARASKLVAAVGASAYAYDYAFCYGRAHRNLRTGVVCAQVLFDYKVWYPLYPEKLDELHTRVASRIANLCAKNGGLYIKLGQSVAAMNHVLPPQYRAAFSVLQDKAPSVPFKAVEKIICEEFGAPVCDLFDDFEEEAVASASIAQVHRAKLKDGTRVAVKIQKPYIQSQMPWDLACYRVVLYLFEKFFDLPMYWTHDYTRTNLLKEADFRVEAENSKECKAALEQEFGADVHIPLVHDQLTAKRVMTAEWIDGVKITDVHGMKRVGASNHWVMDRIINVFGHQIFSTGFIHCDPHPGNMLIRPRPDGRGTQLVLLDHGMYIRASERFRKQYCELWKAIFLLDRKEIVRICTEWGIADGEMFASMQLMRPYQPDKPIHENRKPTRKELLAMQARAKDNIRSLLSNTELTPRELIFVARNMNLVRANNKELGSPVNRVNILASRAVSGISSSFSLYERVSFQCRLFILSVAFMLSELWVKAAEMVGAKAQNYEEMVEKQMERTAHEKFGLKIDFDA